MTSKKEVPIRKCSESCTTWDHRHRCIATAKLVNLKGWGTPFGCLLCDHIFCVDDGFRWIYANGSDRIFLYGNFFVCDNCDQGDDATKKEATKVINEFKNHSLMLKRIRIEP